MRTPVPEMGMYQAKQVPAQARRWGQVRPTHKVRICADNRVYVAWPFTIAGPVEALPYGPQERADRDYWISRITMEVGRHDDATHPAGDGTPSGQAILGNMRRISRDLTDDQPILNSDSRLRIAPDHHQDAINDEEDGPYDTTDFNIHHLDEGDRFYPQLSQVGSGRPGTLLVMSIILVPIP